MKLRKTEFRDAGKFPYRGSFSGDAQIGGGRGNFSVKLELTQVAVHSRPRTDAFHDLLAQVAALGEVQRPGLRCLLGQMAFGEVDAVPGCSVEHAERFDGVDPDRLGTGGGESAPDARRMFRGKPKLVAGNE